MADDPQPPLTPKYIGNVVEFDDGISYEILRSLASYRSCHDGIPAEARIVVTCCQKKGDSRSLDEFVMKIKIQIPGGEQRPSNSPEPGPSTTTKHELQALVKFRDANSAHTPHLVHYKQTVQADEGPLPGGYLTFMVMTKVPGDSLYNLYYWGMPTEEREAVIREFLVALKSIYAQGIEPVDCGLRNILWERETNKCSIIDFELWRDTDEPLGDETKELQRWGLARQPTAKNHFEAFYQTFRRRNISQPFSYDRLGPWMSRLLTSSLRGRCRPKKSSFGIWRVWLGLL